MINYKQILPININYKIKNCKKFFIQKNFNLKVESNRKYIYFLDAPSYGNLGDQAIALAMEKFMKDYFQDYEQIEFRECDIINYITWIKRNIKKDDIICLTGGGNMGVMYQKYEAIRRIIINTFPDNKIIIFPQTISYGDSKYGKSELEKSKKIYNQHKNLLLMAREEKSFKIMKDLYYNCNVILTPDIVLYLDYRKLVENHNGVGFCFRDDKESILSKEEKEKIISNYDNYNNITTLIENDINIDSKTRKGVVEKKLKQFAENSLVITDRLHGMIFAYITNVPCIAFNNSNGKIQGVYKWIENKGNTILLTNWKNVSFQHGNNERIVFDEVVYYIKKFIN